MDVVVPTAYAEKWGPLLPTTPLRASLMRVELAPGVSAKHGTLPVRVLGHPDASNPSWLALLVVASAGSWSEQEAIRMGVEGVDVREMAMDGALGPGLRTAGQEHFQRRVERLLALLAVFDRFPEAAGMAKEDLAGVKMSLNELEAALLTYPSPYPSQSRDMLTIADLLQL